VATLLGNTLRWETESLARQFPGLRAGAQVMGEHLAPPTAEHVATELSGETLPVELYGGVGTTGVRA
jgi:hypothetical protein